MSAIQSIHINNLQRLRNITVDFEQTGVTAIMGANGSGKTTLLQALACVYRRNTKIGISQKNYRYYDFFKPYDGNNWNSANYDIKFHDRDDDVSYTKNSGKWKPETQHRTMRYVKYISILDCVPDQEKEHEKDLTGYEKENINLGIAKKRTLLSKVGAALNKQYDDASYGRKAKGLKQFFHATVTDRTHGILDYPSHYMGAGEQKVIHIINEVLRAPKGALILIEELDMSLHESAIHSLITFLSEQAANIDRQLQIVFTTHWLGVQAFCDELNIISLYEEPATQVIEVRKGFDPQFIYNLTGDYQALRQIKIWVEDKLAHKIVSHVARTLDLRELLEIKEFGSAQNAFTVAAATALVGEKLDRTIVVTDGDRYLTPGEKSVQIQRNVDGHGVQAEQWREQSLSLIVDLDAPNGVLPEKVLLDLCRGYVENDAAAPQWLRSDLQWIRNQIPVIDGKEAIHALRQHKGMTNEQIEESLIQEASRAQGWNTYVAPLVARLNQTAQNIGMPNREEEAA